MPKLTKRRVDAIVAGPRPREVWDDELKGFGIRVHPTGRKVFIVMTRVQGRQVRVTIGQHGAFTVAGARARAVEIIAKARAGEDPSPRRNGAREVVTVRTLCRRFLDDYVSVHCKPRTLEDYSHSVNGFILPKLGAFRVSDVRRDHVAALHQDMRETPYQANRTLAVLSKMFNLAELWEICPDGSNPCRHVKRYKERRRERFLSDAEYVRLGEALRDAERSEMPSAVAAIRLLMLTGCRLSEILTLRWEYVEMEAGRLCLPDSKSGAKIVHLGEPALAVLRGIQRTEGNPWVYRRPPPWSPSCRAADYLETDTRPGGLGRCKDPRSAALFCKRWLAGRRGLADDWKTAWSHTSTDHCQVRPPCCRPGQGGCKSNLGADRPSDPIALTSIR